MQLNNKKRDGLAYKCKKRTNRRSEIFYIPKKQYNRGWLQNNEYHLQDFQDVLKDLPL